MKKKRVLIVSNHKKIRSYLSEILSELGFDADDASDGVEALGLILENPAKFSLLMIDTDIPELDGASLYKVLIQENIIIKTLFISGSFTSKKRLEELNCKYRFLRKPFTKEHVKNKIEELYKI